MNLNIIAKKGINSLNCSCHSSSAHTLRNTQSCSLKAGVKYSRHNSFLLQGWRGFWAAWREVGEILLLWENFNFFFFFIAMMIIDSVPAGHKGSLLARAAICKWIETKRRWTKNKITFVCFGSFHLERRPKAMAQRTHRKQFFKFLHF